MGVNKIFLGNNKILAGFTNKHGGVSDVPFNSFNLGFHVDDNEKDVTKNRQLLMQELETDKLAWMKQIHSDNIKIVNKAGKISMTDGLITNKSGLALMVMVADCIPILFYDPTQKVVAVAHAGREGSFKNISGKLIVKMQKNFRCNPQNILVSLGPAIQKTCYKVDKKIINTFQKKWGMQYIFNENYLDLQKLNKNQLLKVDILKNNIKISNICTHCDKNYFSYRRDKVTGRFAGVIVLK